MSSVSAPSADYATLALDIKRWARELGFADCGIAGTDLGEDELHLKRWLDDGHHGEMDYMARHGDKRSRPAELEPGTLRLATASAQVFRSEPLTGRVKITLAAS